MKVIHPNGPDEYKYTSDYREIPREYLNPRIPKGRGIVKWQPFVIYTIFLKKLLYPINIHNLYVHYVYLYLYLIHKLIFSLKRIINQFTLLSLHCNTKGDLNESSYLSRS
ncbi:hypothetical protein BMJ13_00070 [Staphylococcus saprophyticus]|uniref:YolD-like protein n=1 Tax=Staphylococcus saprophyticus TaxID=29385 RepID=A0A380HPZ6_STASA|nr:hypothetical protein BMJ13_00070 [Staphylococcus saprophyticus]SUM83670.1 YolD-like protein [Staphylococcus saprophyticus]